MLRVSILSLLIFAADDLTFGAERVLDAEFHHLRSGTIREWSDFPEQAEAGPLSIAFDARPNTAEQTLRLRHVDLKHAWRLLLNGKPLGNLPRDENDMVTLWPIPAGALVEGKNTLTISPGSELPDDIRIGEVRLLDQATADVLKQATLKVAIVDPSGQPLPSRLTIVDANGSLVPLGAKSDRTMAVRNGVVYSADGKVTVGLMPGSYTLYAGRGFEYSIATAQIEVATGETVERRLEIQREVPTPGYISCDTHVHTLTYSGHGDATAEERMLTIAGEGLELAIASEHNVHADYRPLAQSMGLDRYFTAAIGNEVTTPVGHFNIFPVEKSAAPPDHRGSDWSAVFASIEATPGVQVIVLNHARDLHSRFRPFDPSNHNALVGENLKGWQLKANAMEVVNSGALQTDPMRLYRDWFGLLNRGLRMTPIGGSDSHDVARKLVAQGRTYVRCADNDPGNINVAEACQSLRAGRVVVSMGLFVEIKVNERFQPGDLATVEDNISVAVRVLGPTWASADRVQLFANGQRIEDVAITAAAEPTVVKWSGQWQVPKPRHDLHLVAIATGPGITAPYWRIAKSYQPTSPVWEPYVIGSTGPVWLDADGDGRPTSAFDYASRAVERSGKDLNALMKELAPYDGPTAAHAANLLAQQGQTLLDADVRAALQGASAATRDGFNQFFEAWKECQAARIK